MPDKSKPPSFDDIMKAASKPPAPERKEPQKPAAPPSEPPRRKPAEGSNESILATGFWWRSREVPTPPRCWWL